MCLPACLSVCVHPYLMRHWVKLAVELSQGDGLWVDNPVLGLVLLHLSPLIEEGEALGEDLNHLALPGKRSPNQHEAMAHNHHLVGLDEFLEEELGQLEVVLRAHLQEGKAGVWTEGRRCFRP